MKMALRNGHHGCDTAIATYKLDKAKNKLR
jgi:hypothetical protein